jgi:N-glycosylase/DNA lyase
MEKIIKRIYFSIKEKIEARLNTFRQLGEKGSNKDIFAELVFCILTPQSKAKVCWEAVKKLIEKNLLLKGSKKQIVKELNKVRFKYNKTNYIIGARKYFLVNGKISIKPRIAQFNNVYESREWMVRNIKGIGYKEASHFLRNIGLGENLAILDRHILKNLKLLKIINEISEFLSKSIYLKIEKKMKEFAEEINIPMEHLDLVLWYKETGEIFK